STTLTLRQLRRARKRPVRRLGGATRRAGGQRGRPAPYIVTVQRNGGEAQQHRFRDELADADAAAGSQHRLEIPGHAADVLFGADQGHPHDASNGQLDRSHAPLAHERRRAAQGELGDDNARLAPEVRAPVYAARHARARRAQSAELGERDSKVDVGSTFGQPLNLERSRPGRQLTLREIPGATIPPREGALSATDRSASIYHM